MFKVKLEKRMANSSGNYPEGSVIEVELRKAKELVNGGYAQALDQLVEPEKVVVKKKQPAKKKKR